MSDWLIGIGTWLVTNIVAILGFLLGVVLIAYILLQKRSFSGTIAWLLVVILVPYVGVPLYLIFGGRKLRRQAGTKDEIDLLAEDEAASDYGPVEKLLRSFDLPGADGGHRVSLCRTGEETYTRMMELLQGAKESIYMATFLFRKDAVGKEVVEVLAEKARASVRVCLLLDGVGCLHTKGAFLKPLTDAGGQYAHFMPVIHRPFRGRTNLRNHRKILVVDEQIVMSGGANVGREYLGPKPYEGRWRDLAFVLEGRAVRQFAQVFRYDWQFASGQWLPEIERKRQESTGEGIVQVVPSGPDVEGDALYDAILTAIYAARKRLWVASPYFVPDESLTQALVLAIRRDVDVQMIMPRKSNHPLADWGRCVALREVQKAGGRVQFFTPGMMHAKILVKDDDLAVVGSANMDFRSLLINYEIAMFVYSRSEIQEIETWIQMMLGGCVEGIEEASLVRHLCEGVVRTLTPLL